MQGDNLSLKDEIKQSLPILAAAVVFGIFVFCAIYFGFLSYPELFYEDAIYQSGGKVSEKIKIITIDNQTLAAYGDENEWSRSYYGQLVDILSSGNSKPSVIAFDLPFSVAKDYKGDLSFVNACKRAGNVVFSSKATFQGHLYEKDGKQIINPYFVESVSVPFREMDEVAQSGFSNMIIDSDGYVRYALLTADSENGTIESFSQMIFNTYCRNTGSQVFPVKKNGDGTAMIRYTGKVNSYPRYSMIDVLEGVISPDEFDDCIVIIGSSADSATDTYKVPVDRQNLMYGVEITANIVQALLENRFYVYPDLFLMAVFCGILSTFLLYYTNGKKIRFMILWLLAFLVGYLGLCAVFRNSGTILYLVYMPIAILVIFAINIIWKYVYERHEAASELKDMLFSMAEAMTEAVDARTPYNATHTRNVAKLSVSLAEYVNSQYKAGVSKRFLTAEEIDQLKLAALLHDVGKIDVSQEVLDKPTRLGRLEEMLYARLDKIICLYRIDILEEKKEHEDTIKEISFLENAKMKIRELNTKEFITGEDKMWIASMGKRCYSDNDGMRIPYLTRLECENLMITRGTLTESEIDQVHEHVIFTNRIISRIRFGKKFENVREIASSHHELLNGNGYPNHSKAGDISLATRILTVADIYDALVSDNRPYKRAKGKRETFMILKEMAGNGELDEELVQFAVELWGDRDMV